METVLITGANRGIGLGLAQRFLHGGWNVLATCRKPQAAKALKSLGPERLRVHALDVTDAKAVSALCAALDNVCIDVLINNAGIIGGEERTAGELDYAAWLRTLEVNTLAPVRLTAGLLPNLRRSRRARVLTLSSQMGSLALNSPGYYAYRSSKAAVNKAMQVLALELAPAGIVVCPVHPGWVRTDMGGAQGELSVEQSAAGIFDLVGSLTSEQSGRFWTWAGDEHPW